MSANTGSPLPRLVVFEGPDGSGKTTLAKELAHYYRAMSPTTHLYFDAFPGTVPDTLGEWVYRFHHGRVTGAPAPHEIAPAALQLLHVAAHVDTIVNRIEPVLVQGGCVILDRYWWSTYAYARRHLPMSQAYALVDAERPFWTPLPPPVIVYLSRGTSLKPDEIDRVDFAQIDAYYREVMEQEHQSGVQIHEIRNDDSLKDTWAQLLNVLGLPFRGLDGDEACPRP